MLNTQDYITLALFGFLFTTAILGLLRARRAWITQGRTAGAAEERFHSKARIVAAKKDGAKIGRLLTLNELIHGERRPGRN